MSFDIGRKPEPVEGGEPIVGDEIPVPGGTIHDTTIVTPEGDVTNDHLTWTPDGGPAPGHEKGHIWP